MACEVSDVLAASISVTSAAHSQVPAHHVAVPPTNGSGVAAFRGANAWTAARSGDVAAHENAGGATIRGECIQQASAAQGLTTPIDSGGRVAVPPGDVAAGVVDAAYDANLSGPAVVFRPRTGRRSPQRVEGTGQHSSPGIGTRSDTSEARLVRTPSVDAIDGTQRRFWVAPPSTGDVSSLEQASANSDPSPLLEPTIAADTGAIVAPETSPECSFAETSVLNLSRESGSGFLPGGLSTPAGGSRPSLDDSGPVLTSEGGTRSARNSSAAGSPGPHRTGSGSSTSVRARTPSAPTSRHALPRAATPSRTLGGPA
eukprot:gnl/TRDRNA2_/TRDRNA2_86594_c0_seq1.p1 gnl/TRDRNA2_/TRDRNA2_86594_c0~~gnl/TRDRNA2_/TRDRNA2_86594_c0_seq1.p1  ORF type:complete len:314 (+),score=27.91 gnl/TRDRNA2_/TRDRNA2_86594_c0_seq1:51-992(+)